MKRKLLTLSISSLVVFLPFSLISCQGTSEEIKISLPSLKKDLPYATLTSNEYLNKLEIMSLKDQLLNLFDSNSQLNENNTQDLTVLLEGNKLSIKVILKSEYIFNNNERTFTVKTDDFKDSSLPGATEIKLPELLTNLPYSSMTISQFNDKLEKETLEKRIIILFGSTTEINGKVLSINSAVNTINKTRLNIGITLKKEYIFVGGNNFHSFETKDFLDKPIVTPPPNLTTINDPELLTTLPYATKTANEFYNDIIGLTNDKRIQVLFTSNTELTPEKIFNMLLQVENTKIKITITLNDNFVFKSNNSKQLILLTNDFKAPPTNQIIKDPILADLPYTTKTSFQFQTELNSMLFPEKIVTLFGTSTDLKPEHIQGAMILTVLPTNALNIFFTLKEGFIFQDGTNKFSEKTFPFLADPIKDIPINNNLFINDINYKDIANAFGLTKNESLFKLDNNILLERVKKVPAVSNKVNKIEIVNGNTEKQNSFIELKINDSQNTLKITGFDSLIEPEFLKITQQQYLTKFEINNNEYFKNLITEENIKNKIIDPNLLFLLSLELQIGDVLSGKLFDKDILIQYKDFISVKDVLIKPNPLSKNWEAEIDFVLQVSFSNYSFVNGKWEANSTKTKEFKRRQNNPFKFLLPKEENGLQYLLDNLNEKTNLNKDQFSSYYFARAKEDKGNYWSANLLEFNQEIIKTYFPTSRFEIINSDGNSGFFNSIDYNDQTGILKIDAFLLNKATDTIHTELITKTYLISGFKKIDDYITANKDQQKNFLSVRPNDKEQTLINKLKKYNIDFKNLKINEQIQVQESTNDILKLFFQRKSTALFNEQNTSSQWDVNIFNNYILTVLGRTFDSAQNADQTLSGRNGIFKVNNNSGFYVKTFSLEKTNDFFTVKKISNTQYEIKQIFSYKINQNKTTSTIDNVRLVWFLSSSKLN
ncbi:MAG: hypothetical protein ACRDA7_00535 [Metamycoplasmataceae bacterium]